MQEYVFPKISEIRHVYPNNTDMKNYLLSIEMPKDKHLLISDEYLSTHLYIDRKGFQYSSRQITTERLKKIFPKAHIIVVFRDKEQWIKSFYKQYITSIYRKNISFETFKENSIENGLLNFEDYEDCLRENFEKVLSLSHETLINNPKKFVNDICEFMDVNTPNFKNVNTNVGLTNRQISFIKNIKNLNIPDEYKKRIVDLFLFLSRGIL